MAKITKTQARKRIEEATKKCVFVYMNATPIHLSVPDMKKLDNVINELRRMSIRMK
jgi:hypothetical protein